MKKFAFIALPVFLLAIFFISKTALAEIATTTDWIGLFEITTPPIGDTKGDTYSGCTTSDSKCWVYANSCSRTAGAAPALSNTAGCNNLVPNPLPVSGTYEFRLYANDQGNPDALIAKSNAMTVAAAPGPGGGNPCPIQATNPRVINGLISAPDAGSNFGNSSATCVTGSPATFAPFKILGYNDLKSIYFTQSKASKPAPNPNTANTLGAVTDGNIYNYTSATGVSTGAVGTPYSYTGTAVVFINGSLSINGNITGTADKGLVLVTGGDINIDAGVTQINAILISGGYIYTKGAGCILSPAPGTDSRLVINGSLVNLNSSSPIRFCRRLADNSQAAELINNEPKYLVILRNLYADTLQKWSEIQ